MKLAITVIAINVLQKRDRRIKMIICLQCGYKFKFVSASVDELGCHTVCPDCGGSFDIEPRCGECENADCEEKAVTSNFLDDKEKMHDFLLLSKKEFLKSYSYLTNRDYEATCIFYNSSGKRYRKGANSMDNSEFVKKCGELLRIAKPNLISCEYFLGKDIVSRHTSYFDNDEYVIITCENGHQYILPISGNSLIATASTIFDSMAHK
jgi:hypothetical protein